MPILAISYKDAVVALAISGLNVTKIVYNVEKFILFNILKLELQYCNPFWNGRSLVAMATSLEKSKKAQFGEQALTPVYQY